MDREGLIRTFDHLSSAYRDRFQLFLEHTDQKANALARTRSLVLALPERQHFIDAGAGTGVFTAELGSLFQRVTAIEPNDALFQELEANLSHSLRSNRKTQVDAHRSPILDPGVFHLKGSASFVLCSHVFYYIEESEWAPNLRTLLDWLSPGGIALVTLQNPNSDCMRMLRSFNAADSKFSVSAIWNSLDQNHNFTANIETVPAMIKTSQEDIAFDIAEWLFAIRPLATTSAAVTPGRPLAPRSAALRQYIRQNFSHDDGFRFSCEQDFLMIRRGTTSVTG